MVFVINKYRKGRIMIFNKKGAMFGLDARIALAIFGALSVISGAALYSAIQDARVTAIVTEMDNVDKAVTAYYLDTGVYPASKVGGDDATLLDGDALLAKPGTLAGWQGPYLPHKAGTTDMLDHTIYGDVSINGMLDADWSNVTLGAGKCLPTSTACSVFVCVSDLSDDMQKAADFKIDGGTTNTANSGNFRYVSGGFACKKGMTFPKESASALA